MVPSQILLNSSSSPITYHRRTANQSSRALQIEAPLKSLSAGQHKRTSLLFMGILKMSDSAGKHGEPTTSTGSKARKGALSKKARLITSASLFEDQNKKIDDRSDFSRHRSRSPIQR